MKNLTYRLAMIIAIVCVGSVSAFAQQVKGTVKSTAGDPIIGATVVVDGTSTGTTSGIDGSFTIDAKDGSTLVVSYIGYATQQINVGGEEPTMRLFLRRIHRTSTRLWLLVMALRRRAL